jgi:hypothetical protein
VQLQGYVQAHNYAPGGYLQEFAVQVVRQSNGYDSVTLYPENTCQDPYGSCAGSGLAPKTLWVTQTGDGGCGATEYMALDDNAYDGIASVILTDYSRSSCSEHYDGALTLVVNYANGAQDWLTGYRTY